MKVNLCGINNAHDKSFIINRPTGSGDNLFIYTRTPIILVCDGKMGRYPAETAVFFRKGRPQHFMAAGQIYVNDFIHFDANDDEMRFIDSLGISSGVAFTDLDPTVFMNIHRYICVEHMTESENRAQSVDLLLKYFMIKLSEEMKGSTDVPLSGSIKNAMRELRSQVYASVEEQYTIESLSARVGLSPSYFQSVYKKMFGRACIDDIIHARVEKARTLLMTTDLSVSTVARECGYENESHFSRQFKRFTGMTPSGCRKKDE